MQIATGVDALQIFDSHGGHLAATEFPEASRALDARHYHCPRNAGLRPGWFANPAQRAGSETGAPPVIVFSFGTHGNWNDLISTGANVIGIDWQFSLAKARQMIPEGIGLQGNLRPR